MLIPYGFSGVGVGHAAAVIACLVAFLLVPLSPATAAPGDFDATFAGGGLAFVDFGGTGSGSQGAHAVLQLSSGSLVIAGVDRDGIMAVSRLTSSGDLDPTFGLASTGTATVSLPDAGGGIAYAVIEQPDHKLVIAGTATDYFSPGATAIAVVRLNDDGTLDGTFGAGGKVVLDLGEGRALVRQPDGKLLIAGGGLSFVVVRLLDSGALDSTFNGGAGSAQFGACTGKAEALALQPSDGKVVVTGTIDCTSTGKSIAFARFNGDGTLDTSFSADGKTSLPAHPVYTFSGAHALVLRPDGRIIAAGGCFTNLGSWFAMAALEPDGSWYSSFAGGGVQCYSTAPSHAVPYAMVRQSNGKLVLAGVSNKDLALFRLSADGVPDPGFGTSGNGTVVVDFPAIVSTSETAFALTVQTNGMLVAAGEIFSLSWYGMVVRIIGDAAGGSPGQIGFGPYSQYTGGEYVNESDGYVTLKVKRVNGSQGVVTAQYATNDGSAVGGSDFIVSSGTLTWAEGETGDKTITIQITQDGATEQAESFTIVLSNATGGAVLTNSVGVVVICDPTNGCGSPAGGGGGGGGGGDSGGGLPLGIFGEISMHDVIGYHFDGVTKNGMRIYMPVTKGFKALKGAQTHVEQFSPALAKLIRRGFESLERRANADKEGLLYWIGTHTFPVLGKIAELYLYAVDSEDLMANAYAGTIISVDEFTKLQQQGIAISHPTGKDTAQQ